MGCGAGAGWATAGRSGVGPAGDATDTGLSDADDSVAFEPTGTRPSPSGCAAEADSEASQGTSGPQAPSTSGTCSPACTSVSDTTVLPGVSAPTCSAAPSASSATSMRSMPPSATSRPINVWGVWVERPNAALSRSDSSTSRYGRGSPKHALRQAR